MTGIFQWTGRNDPEDGESALRWHHIINADGPAELGLLGFACDMGVARNQGRVGAAGAPDILRGALANLAWHGPKEVRDFGNIAVPDGDVDPLHAAQNNLSDTLADVLAETGKAIVLGGGHETAFGSFGGLYKHLNDPKKKIGILNLDAHFDIRLRGEGGISSGTPFTQIRERLHDAGQGFDYMVLGISKTGNTRALFDRAGDWGVRYMMDEQVTLENFAVMTRALEEFTRAVDVLYLTLDLDVLPHWQMPAVSAPSGRGVDIGVIEKIIDVVAASNVSWPLSDIVEFNPKLDNNGNAAKTAARLIDKLARAMMG